MATAYDLIIPDCIASSKGLAANGRNWRVNGHGVGERLATRAGVISLTVFAGLELIVLVRFAFSQGAAYGPPVVDWGDVRAWVYLIFMVSILAAGAYGWWASRQK